MGVKHHDLLVNVWYTALGQLNTIDRYIGVGASQLVTSAAYNYDPAERLLGLTHTQGASTPAA